MEKIKVLILLYLLPTALFAQTNRYMVFLSDKDNSTYSVDQPEEFLSAAAIERRADQNITITQQDLPVNATYLQGIKDLNVAVFYTSKWFNAALIQTEETKISSVENLSYVDSVIFIAPNAKLTFGSRKFSEEEGEELQAQNDVQLSILGADDLHNEELMGTGVSIAFLDAGFVGVDNSPDFEHLFTNGQLITQFNLVENNDAVFKDSNHGTRVFSTVAAQSADFQGIAVDANFMLYLTEDVTGEYRIEEYNWLIAAEKADSAGVDIISTSVGYNIFDDPSMSYTYEQLDGSTTVITQAASLATSKGILVVTSAGNEGNNSWNFITAPADAENILAVGSVNSNRIRSGFSSNGPSADGRIKPDVMAIGEGAVLVNESGITSGNGTSFAAPQVAGLAALLWQKNPMLTNLELRELVISLGSQINSPDNQFGYGIPKYIPEGVTGFAEGITKNGFILFPNPINRGFLNIKFQHAETQSQLTILNTSGQIVLDQVASGDSDGIIKLDVTALPAGVYLVKSVNHQTVYKGRFVKF